MQNTQTVKWEASGHKIKMTVRLTDGYQEWTGSINGIMQTASGIAKINHPKVSHCFGKIGITSSNYNKLMVAQREITLNKKSHRLSRRRGCTCPSGQMGGGCTCC